MVDFNKIEKNNIKMLGILVRYNRVKKGFSLRDLAQLTNISHTLISNFEKGQVIPHRDIIKDIFDKLDLTFYDSPDISIKFRKLYDKIFHHILYYEYAAAAILIKEIEKDRETYENSVEVINVAIIRCLYYTIANIFSSDKDELISQYEIVLDFFSPNQKQLFYFIKGLDLLNQESYRESRDNFEIALSMGDENLDLLIKDYYVVTLSKSSKYVDVWRISSESIKKFEANANYIRAMRLRTRIAYDYVRILKYKEASDIYNKVLELAKKYKVKDLENRCNTNLGFIAILNDDMKLGEKYINRVKPPYEKIYYYLKFDIAAKKNNDEQFLKLYNEYISLDWVQKSAKTKRFFEMIIMRYDEKYMDKNKYIKNAEELIKLGFKSDDAQLIETACQFLMNVYKKDRHYKQALEVNERYLHYIKYDTR